MPGQIANSVMLIQHSQIEPDPDQPRKNFDEDGIQELAASMTAMGQRTPIEIRPHADSTKRNPRYIIIAGERRWRAAGTLGWETVKAVVYRDISDHDAVMSQLLENIVRRDLDPVEKAEAYRRMMDNGYSSTDIAAAVGSTARNVEWYTGMLDARPEIVGMVRQGEVKPMVAVFLSKLAPHSQLRALKTIREKGLTTREAELLCSRIAEEDNSEPLALFDVQMLTVEQTAAVKDFDKAFAGIRSNLSALMELEKEHQGALGQAIANPGKVEAEVDEVIKLLYQVRNSLRVSRVATTEVEDAE